MCGLPRRCSLGKGAHSGRCFTSGDNCCSVVFIGQGGRFDHPPSERSCKYHSSETFPFSCERCITLQSEANTSTPTLEPALGRPLRAFLSPPHGGEAMEEEGGVWNVASYSVKHRGREPPGLVEKRTLLWLWGKEDTFSFGQPIR